MAPKGTPVDPGLISRVASQLGGALGSALDGTVGAFIRGAAEAWFGPLNPLPPVAPPETKGRQFDYPVGSNIVVRPRGEQGEGAIGFEDLRRMADPAQGGLDLLRLGIETRKDQMAALRWSVRARDGKSDGGQKARDIELALRRPDRIHTFSVWQRMLLEDLFVIDAPCIYVAPAVKGKRVPQVMDGALVKPLIDGSGRTPLPPDPAYQQALHGLPAVPYTADELIYAPRNRRSHRIYGFSPVEQVVTIVNIALRRQLSQLEYYTAGSVPDVVFGTPESWNKDQVSAFQNWWDSILSGNTEERRRARFVPGGVKPFPLKPDQLNDEFDEWLARIICYAFSLPPTALVKQMNRATSETQKESAAEEGLEPLKLHFGEIMGEVLEKAFDAPELEFVWQDEEIADPKVKADVAVALAGGPVFDVDEVRADMYAKPALTPEQRERMKPAPPALAFAGADDAVTSKGQAEKIAKARRSLRPIDRNRVQVVAARAAMQAATAGFLAELGAKVAASLRQVAKAAEDDEGAPKTAADHVDDADWTSYRDQVRPRLVDVAKDGAAEALRQVDREMDALLSQANERAVAWAEKHAATLVKQVRETTRDRIRELVTSGLEAGKSNDVIADELEESLWFSDSRAETIARTETAFADVQGNLEGWRASGVVAARRWKTSQNEAGTCEQCLALGGAVMPLDEEFPEGDPPLHPNCECDLIPVVAEPDDE